MEERNFGKMPFEEFEKWEKETNSVVLFDNEKGIAFQKAKDNDGNPVLIIMVDDDSRKNTIVLFDEDLKRLMGFLFNCRKLGFHDLMGSVN